MDRAHAYLARGRPIPLDLYSELRIAGIDVRKIEKDFSNLQKRKYKNGTTI